MLKPVSPTEVRDLLRNGARLVDIREPDEYESVHVEGAEPLPLSLARYMRPAPSTPEKPVIFTCHSGNRVGQNERMLEDLAGGPAYKMVGGMDGWISAALPVRRGIKYSLERQVRIAAGSLVFLGTLCGIVI
ncbi:MAG: rhodanese-like domain-containing protein, partial [Desulfovibrio sp.]